MSTSKILELIEKEEQLIKLREEKINVLLDIIKFLKESKKKTERYDIWLAEENYLVDSSRIQIEQYRKTEKLNNRLQERLRSVDLYLISRVKNEIRHLGDFLNKCRSK